MFSLRSAKSWIGKAGFKSLALVNGQPCRVRLTWGGCICTPCKTYCNIAMYWQLCGSVKRVGPRCLTVVIVLPHCYRFISLVGISNIPCWNLQIHMLHHILAGDLRSTKSVGLNWLILLGKQRVACHSLATFKCHAGAVSMSASVSGYESKFQRWIPEYW